MSTHTTTESADSSTVATQAAAAVVPAPVGDGPPGPSVLLVDDNAELRELIAVLLEEEGISVTTAEGAEAALAELASRRPDVLIVDLVMPDVHGLQLLIDARALPECAELPALVLSALPPGETRDRAEALVLSMGIAEFVDKPASARHLLVALGRLLTVA